MHANQYIMTRNGTNKYLRRSRTYLQMIIYYYTNYLLVCKMFLWYNSIMKTFWPKADVSASDGNVFMY